jgi:hypothetical protein
MGFSENMDKIVAAAPAERQTRWSKHHDNTGVQMAEKI